MGRKTDSASRQLQRIRSERKKPRPSFAEFRRWVQEAGVQSELKEPPPASSALQKACQEFELDPGNLGDRLLLLEFFAEAHYGKRRSGRPRKLEP
jgi:hypothetical protein